MNLKKLGFKAAIATAVVAGAVSTASAAKAFSVGDTLHFTSTDVVKFDFNGMPDHLDFGNNVFDPSGISANSLGRIFVTPGSKKAGDFVVYDGAYGTIKDLSLAPKTPVPVANFITIGDLSFELTNFISGTFPFPGSFDTFALSVEGIFRNASGTVLGDGLLTAQFEDGETSGDSSYSGTFVVTQVPTPALLPGLIGLGMGMLRKRKKEMAAASTEA